MVTDAGRLPGLKHMANVTKIMMSIAITRGKRQTISPFVRKS